VIVFFSMLAPGHLRRLLPLVEGVVRAGARACVYTDSRFRTEVANTGGEFFDLFARFSLADADADSFPMAVRGVSYAGHFAGALLPEIAALRPTLIVHDTHAVIGRVIATSLGIPRVNVCAGHNVDPVIFQAILAADPRVMVSDRCHKAVELLRDRYGIADSSPFCYVSSLSPFLNVYCEPPEFLTREERLVFEPIAFFGSVPSQDSASGNTAPHPKIRSVSQHFQRSTALRVYVSFGTVVWRSYPAEALTALRTIASTLACRSDIETILSLGGAAMDSDVVSSLEASNVSVHALVDQRSVLAEADVFITHHGLNSTHEAIWHRVPMLSCPFFWDQPALAAKCQALGIAIPLFEAPRGPVTAARLLAALEEIAGNAAFFAARLEVARDYELQVMAGRRAVVGQLLRLAKSGGEPRPRHPA